MAFKACDQSGRSHHAAAVTRSMGPFRCQVCQGEMSFVDPQVRMRPHFRHRVESNCAWEPETSDHENAKMVVCEAINRLGRGTADVEIPIGSWIADVLWTDGNHRVAFEVQRANYSWVRFDEKLAGYRELGVAVVYLFIGPDFYRRDQSNGWRLKDIERRLFLGRPEDRASPYWHNHAISFMELERIHPESLGLVAGAYLRRKADSDVLMVREPIFYHGRTKAGYHSSVMSVECGRAVTPLPDYLGLVHDAFLGRPGSIFWNGNWYSRREEAVWASFFTSMGFSFRFSQSDPGQAGVFQFSGKYPLDAMVRGASFPASTAENTLVLDAAPTLQQDHLFVGTLNVGPVPDDAVLACYTRDVPEPVLDFGQFNQIYAGAISGLHDGGFPGGRMGDAIAKQANELWLDANARLGRGVSFPLGTATFKGLNGYPRFRLNHS